MAFMLGHAIRCLSVRLMLQAAEASSRHLPSHEQQDDSARPKFTPLGLPGGSGGQNGSMNGSVDGDTSADGSVDCDGDESPGVLVEAGQKSRR